MIREAGRGGKPGFAAGLNRLIYGKIIQMKPMPQTFARLAAHVMVFAVIAFLAVATAAQCWRRDLDWIAIPLSTYLYGPGGAYVRSVYYLMALGLLGFAPASYMATAAAQRSVLGSALFAAAGAILPLVAISELFRGTPYQELAAFVHRITAPATFLWLSFGMLLVSTRWRRDPGMKKGSLPGLVLAWAATFVLWFQVLVPGLPNGLMEKLAIVLILLWLGWAARRIGSSGGSRRPNDAVYAAPTTTR